MQSDDIFIQINNLKFSYTDEDDKPVDALKGISLDIKKGEFIAVTGNNGSGKSTLALNLNALLVPTDGDVYVDGLNTKDEESVWEIRKRVGMVFQNPDNQLVSSIIEDDVAFGPENIGIEPAEIRIRVDESLKAVNMYDYRKKGPHLLSGGQKQRVAIAGVLAMRPNCIIFDEATAMLDPKGRKEIMQIIKTLHREGHTIIMITHFMEEAAYADRIAVLSSGQLIMCDTPENVFKERKALAETALELPFAVELSDKLRKGGIAVPQSVVTEEALADFLCASK